MTSTFPDLPGITYPSIRSPIWATDKEESISGKRSRYSLRNVPMWRWEVPFSFLRSTTALAEWQELVCFFNSLYGSQGIFEYPDPIDYQAVNQSFAVGDGVSTAFQLVRTGPTPAGTFTENVLAPTTITLMLVGASSISSTQFSISTGGIVNFSTLVGNGVALAWSGEFNWLARMDDDVIELSRFMESLWELKSLKFTSEL